jgi:hypothetical protein
MKVAEACNFFNKYEIYLVETKIIRVVGAEGQGGRASGLPLEGIRHSQLGGWLAVALYRYVCS